MIKFDNQETKPMKKYFFLLSLSILLLPCCDEKEESPLEGSWQMIYSTSFVNGSSVYEFPGNTGVDQVKMWSDNHFLFVGRVTTDTTVTDNYGGGTYSYDGKTYFEEIRFHSDHAMQGTSLRMKLEIRNDTIIQYWPVDNIGVIDNSNYRFEKYIRLD